MPRMVIRISIPSIGVVRCLTTERDPGQKRAEENTADLVASFLSAGSNPTPSAAILVFRGGAGATLSERRPAVPPFESMQLNHVLTTADGAWSFVVAASRERA
jgi:hypothetical protein